MKRALIATAAAAVLAAAAFTVPASARGGGGGGGHGGGASHGGGGGRLPRWRWRWLPRWRRRCFLPQWRRHGVPAVAAHSRRSAGQFRSVGAQFRSNPGVQFRGAPFRGNARFAHRNFRGRSFGFVGAPYYAYGSTGYYYDDGCYQTQTVWNGYEYQYVRVYVCDY